MRKRIPHLLARETKVKNAKSYIVALVFSMKDIVI